MVQPPYQPPSGSGPGEDSSGAQPWRPPGSDEPTQQFGPPGGPQREPTQRLPEPGQYGPSAPWGPPPPYVPPGQSAAPGPYGPPDPYGPWGQYSPPGRYGPPPGQFPPPAQFGPPDLYAQPVFGRPWGSPGGPQAPRPGNRNTVIALVLAGILALAAVGVGLFLFLGNDRNGAAAGDQRTSFGSSDLPAPSVEPDGLGADSSLDELAESCYDGDMRACDSLYDRSDAGSDYETYGDTCAGRQPSGTLIYCTESFPQD